MTDPVLHIDPNSSECSLTLKEAVIEGVVRHAHDLLTGRDDAGKILNRDSPSQILAAGFLLPSQRRTPIETPDGPDADATSPIHVSTVGLSFQIVAGTQQQITVFPKGSVYVRILPTSADLRDVPITFGLTKEARDFQRDRKKTAFRRLLAQNGIPERSRDEAQELKARSLRQEAAKIARDELAREKNIPTPVLEQSKDDAVLVGEEAVLASESASNPKSENDVSSSTDAQLGGATQSAKGEALQAASNVERPVDEIDDSSTKTWGVSPDADPARLPPDSLVELAEIPPKWLRLEIEWPTLVISTSATRVELEAAAKEHSDRMSAALQKRLNEWIKDEDPASGGKLWAMPRATAQSALHKVKPSQVAGWEATLKSLRASAGRRAVPEDIRLKVTVSIVNDPLDDTVVTVRVLLENRSEMVDRSRVPDKLMDRGLYLAGLRAEIPAAAHRQHILERIEPSYRWNRWLVHDGLGINAGIERLPGPPGVVALATTYMPVWRQPRIVPHKIEAEPTFVALSSDDGGLPILRDLVDDYEAWLAATIRNEPWRIPAGQFGDEARERERFETIDVRAWQSEIERMRLGLRVLEAAKAASESGRGPLTAEVLPLTAWRATNATFQRTATAGGRATTWRLFQLAFLLAHVPIAVSRVPEWADRTDLFPSGWAEEEDARVTLLYFPTGGGKSEAFFALLVMQAFVDRLRGKKRGVSAIVRYPLRLLTAQQANRFARVLAMAELERRALHVEGDAFQLGFWVGSGNTPNGPKAEGFNDLPRWDSANLSPGAETQLRKEDAGYKAVRRWRRLTDCPFCLSSTVALRRRDESGIERLAHVCVETTCDWNRLHAGIEPLPFHVMDTDIYAYAPTILLGTVDKMAMIGHSPYSIAQVFGMFGFAPWMRQNIDASGRPRPGHERLVHPRRGLGTSDGWADPIQQSCIPVGPVYGNVKTVLYDPFPAIEVQDEAHLLNESLGTFSGIFGTTLETALSDLAPLLGGALTSRYTNGQPRRTKIIAASATVQRPERQIEMLYQRQVSMFPHPGPDLYESYFARLQPTEKSDAGRDTLETIDGHPPVELRTPTRRLYISIPTNGRPHTSGTVAVLSALHLTLSRFYRLATDDDPSKRVEIRALLTNVLQTEPLAKFHIAAIEQASDAAIACAVDLARIVLAYVNNKKGGDSIHAALNEFVPRDHARAAVNLGRAAGVRTGLITGSIEMEAIQKVVEDARPRWAKNAAVNVERDFFDQLRTIIATSAISHGVDIDQLNLMVFAGLPTAVAEYVQASSRIGRAHVGVSILVPTPQRPRDVHVVGIHDVFHRFLERLIQSAAIDRWGKTAIERTLGSIISVKLCAIDHFRALASANEANKKRYWDSSGIGPVAEDAARDKPSTTSKLRAFIEKSIWLDHPTFAPSAKAWYSEDFLKVFVRKLIDDAITDLYRTASIKAFLENTGRPTPMTSLRDVDSPGVIGPAKFSRSKPLRLETTGALMHLLRRGSGGWDELDTDQNTEDLP
jgi:hypothetical protein